MKNFLLNSYLPKNFCREFVEIKGDSHQLGMYMALVLGQKPLMDDRIHTSKLSEFKKACKKYKIYLRENIIFLRVPKQRIPKHIIGKDNLTTTSGFGFPVDCGKEGMVQVFLSKDKKILQNAMWYPAIIKNRVIFPPLADQFSYGRTLGYPDCCVKYFKKFNNWSKYNYLYKAYLNTKSKASFLCNPCLKETGYSYIYHMPCSYSCQKTIRQVRKLRGEIEKHEPEYVKLTDNILKNPCLVFFERMIYCFQGHIKNGFLEYSDFWFTSFEKEKDVYSNDLKQANKLKIKNDQVILYKGKNITKIIQPAFKSDVREHPFLLEFS